MTVVSALGQPFQAEVDLVSVGREELATLSVQLASPEAYRQANLQYTSSAAGLRLSIEKRGDGQPYIRVTSTRPINEPFLDLLIELNWASGRLVREYTALLDPPGYGTAPLAAAPVAAPEVRAAPIAPPAPVAAPAPAPAPVAAPAPAPAPAGSYGPIQRGETMGKIAGELKPAGVSLEQMLIALFRSNPDAFIEKNVNLVKAGKILRVPDQAEVEAIPQAEAATELRTQVADWNAYRARVADTAGAAPEAPASTASGKITARVDDAAGGAPKDVVKLSKGEPPGAAAGAGDKSRSTAERIRALEEEVIAREKALAEANERVAQLEKTIKDMQRLAEIKSPAMAAAQQQAAAKTAGKPDAKPDLKPEPMPAPKPKPEAVAKAPPADAAKPEAAMKPAPVDKPAVTAEAPKPKPQPRVVQTPPPPEPELMDIVMENLPLVGGGAVVLLGGLYFGLARRRRARAGAGDKADDKIAPAMGEPTQAAENDAHAATGEMPAARPSGEDVDPLAEAEVYVAYGRDAQAEEILKEAMAKDPAREDVQVKLLEIYSARKDKSAFNALAQGVNRLTGGQGENWLKVAAMGYALDAGNALYAAGRDMAASQPPGGQEAADFDFNLDAGAQPDTVDVAPAEDNTVAEPPQKRAAEEATASQEPDIAFDEPQSGAMTTDISFDSPEPGAPTTTDIALDGDEGAAKEEESNVVDFNIELPKLDDVTQDSSVLSSKNGGDQGTESGMDFKLDLDDINLSLDDKGEAGADAAGGADRDKDTQWYDVQTKFDLAKAYQEMGDKDGAREILQEVIKEGDAEQQSEAKKLLETLG